MKTDIGKFLDEYQLHIDLQSRYIDFINEAGKLGGAVLMSTDYGAKPAEVTETFKEEAGDCLFSLIALLEENGMDPEDLLEEVLDRYRRRMEAYPGNTD